MHLGKTVENRTWALRLRTPFECVIHAGKAWGRDERFDAEDLRVAHEGTPLSLPLGALVGIVTVTGCITRPRNEVEREWFCGPYAFTLENPRPFPIPITWKGALGFFELPLEFTAS